MAPSYALSAWFFTRALSLVYFVAFLSLGVQARGLWGSRGILPIATYFGAIEIQVDASRYWLLPSAFWLSSTDTVIVGAAAVGALAAFAALCGLAQGWMLLLCYALYLSYSSAGQEFLSFQWDALLLEVGFLSLFAVPWSLDWSLREAVEPHWVVRWMFYIVLFKLMFLSGVVKLMSGDQSWRDLTAMTYHYWTQPLPNPVSPFMHALPRWFHQFETVMTFVVELGFPFLILWWRTRLIAAAGFLGLSLLILVTGNYTFFNWLTIFICFWLVPDSWWRSLADALPFELHTVESVVAPHPFTAASMLFLCLLSVFWCARWFLPDGFTTALAPVLRVAQTFHVSNSYGLFATMTKSRPEIVIEGSDDGSNWKEYEFRYKPGRLYRRPPVIAPHQPRLDWQMWFAALGSLRENLWVQNLMIRLFQGAPEVLSFFDVNPFPDQPPKYLRARLYEYEFASPSQIFENGQWWKRSLQGDYSPTFERP